MITKQQFDNLKYDDRIFDSKFNQLFKVKIPTSDVRPNVMRAEAIGTISDNILSLYEEYEEAEQSNDMSLVYAGGFCAAIFTYDIEYEFDEEVAHDLTPLNDKAKTYFSKNDLCETEYFSVKTTIGEVIKHFGVTLGKFDEIYVNAKLAKETDLLNDFLFPANGETEGEVIPAVDILIHEKIIGW